MKKLIIILAGILALFVFIQNSTMLDSEAASTNSSVPIDTTTPVAHTASVQ